MFKRMIENEELKVSFKENKLAEKEKLFIQELIVGFGELKDSYCEVLTNSFIQHFKLVYSFNIYLRSSNVLSC